MGTWDFDPATGELAWSDRCKAIFGLPPDTPVADQADFFALVHPDDRERIARSVDQALDPGGSGDYEAEYRSSCSTTGSIRWAVARGRAVFEGAGADRLAIRFLGTIIDVTDRKLAEQGLRDSEARFRQLADAMPQIVWTARPDGYLDYYNRRWYEFTGFPEGFRGGDESWEPILHPDDVALCRDTWYGSVRSGEPYNIEYRFKDRRDNFYRWHLGRALPIKDAEGRVVKWFGTCTDIDDQKRATEELARAKEAAEGANRAKDQFLPRHALQPRRCARRSLPSCSDVSAILDDPQPDRPTSVPHPGDDDPPQRGTLRPASSTTCSTSCASSAAR